MTEENQFLREQTLREIYYDSLTGYQSAQKLYDAAREKGLNVSLNEVKNWLSHPGTYVHFRQPTNN